MKTRILITLSALLIALLTIFSCKKNLEECCGDHGGMDHNQPGTPYYSTVTEFTQGLNRVATLVEANQVIAFLDTTQDGKPDIQGRKQLLVQFVQQILNKLQNDQVQSAVYDVFHFDGATFSLISFLMKARMVSNISEQTLTDILAQIPLPPAPVAGFTPPVVPAPVPVHDCATCNCKPKVKIRATLVYVPDCGNYKKETTGYIVNNVLTNMTSGVFYKFVPELEGCGCGGTWTYNIDAPAGASYGSSASGNAGNGVSFQGLSSGTYTITFTYKCGCCCGATASASVSISIK